MKSILSVFMALFVVCVQVAMADDLEAMFASIEALNIQRGDYDIMIYI